MGWSLAPFPRFNSISLSQSVCEILHVAVYEMQLGIVLFCFCTLDFGQKAEKRLFCFYKSNTL